MNTILLCAIALLLHYTNAYSQQIIKPKWVTPTTSGGKVTIIPDGTKMLLSGSTYCSVLDVRKGGVNCQFDTDIFGGANGGCFSGSGDKVAVDVSKGDIKIFDANSGQLLVTCIGYPRRQVRSLCFNYDDSKLVIYTFSNTVELCDVNTGEKLREFFFDNETIIQTKDLNSISTPIEYLKGDIIVTEDKEGKVKIWDLNTEKVIYSFQGKLGHKLVSFSDDRTKLLLHNVEFLMVYDMVKGEVIYRNDEIGGDIANFDRKSNRIITSDFKKIRVINLENKKVEFVVEHETLVNCIETNYKGDKIAVANRDLHVHVWDIVTGKKISRLNVDRDTRIWVRFLGESDSLVTLGHNIKIWDVSTAKTLYTIDGGGWTNKLRLNKTNTHIVSIGGSILHLNRAANGASVFSYTYYKSI